MAPPGMPNTTSAPTRSSAYTSACAPVARTLPGLVTCARGGSDPTPGAGTADPGAPGTGLAGTGLAGTGAASGASAGRGWSAARADGWCGERAARSRGLGPEGPAALGSAPAGRSVPAGPLRPVICSVIGKSPLARIRRHKKSPRAGRQSRGARSELLGQLPARRPSTRICGYFTSNTLLPFGIGTSTADARCLTFRDGPLMRPVWSVVRRPDQGLHSGGAHRPGHQEPLAVAAAHLAQGGELARLLDALGDDLQAEVAADLHHGPGQQGERVVVAEAGHERGIDLDDVQRQLAQVRQRGVPSAKVIDGHLDTQPVQLREPLDDQPVLLDQDPLVHLDGERLGWQPGFGEDRVHLRAEAGRGNLPAGQVHRDADV